MYPLTIQMLTLNGKLLHLSLVHIHSALLECYCFKQICFAHCTRNDILRKHKIIPEKPPSPTPMIEEALTEARRLAHENRLEGKELDELAELEDEEDEDFLEFYRYITIFLPPFVSF
jgi:hypothetical protein